MAILRLIGAQQNNGPEAGGGQGGSLPGAFLPCSPAAAEKVWRTARKEQQEKEQSVQQRRHSMEEERRRIQEDGQRQIEQARQQAYQEAGAVFKEVAEELLEQIQQRFAQKMDQIEEEIISLSGEMVGQIIQREIMADDSIVVDVVQAALAKVAGASRLEVRVNPADEEIIRQAQQELVSALDGIDNIRVVSSDKVGRGGTIISSDRGEVDARLSTQVEILLEHMKETTNHDTPL